VASKPSPDDVTLPMTIGNMGFMLDRLGQDCAPLQFLRELTQNAIEAIIETPQKEGEMVWDVDWNRHTLTGVYKLAIIDTGIGMTGDEMLKYLNALSSSMYEQSQSGNFGVGAKIAAAPRNHAGLVYLSWKNGVGSMIHLWRDPETREYGLRQFARPDGTFGHWATIEDDIKPKLIHDHGTMVVLLGNDVEEDTMEARDEVASPSRWIARYLNTRYFSFPAGITIKAREGWEEPRSDTDRNVLRSLTGQEVYLHKHASASGSVSLTNGSARWWVLKDEDALTQNSGFVASSGHVAALYQHELYEMMTGRGGVARLQSFGVIFGYQRVVIYVEPKNGSRNAVSSNTARTALLMDGEPLPWADWAAEFRASLPDEITRLMEEVSAGSVAADHKQSIKERLKQIRDLFRISRYRPAVKGNLRLDEDALVAGGKPKGQKEAAREIGNGAGGRTGGRAGDIYAMFLKAQGVPGEEFHPDRDPEVKWVTAAEKTRVPPDMEDRAAKFLPDQNLLMINGDFRVFTDMVERWWEKYQQTPGAREVVEDVVREWFEQSLIEAVLGAQALRDARFWSVDDMHKVWSEEALTAAVMPRYHIDVAVKRALGAKLGTLRDKVAV
jgi:hypothetical protein